MIFVLQASFAFWSIQGKSTIKTYRWWFQNNCLEKDGAQLIKKKRLETTTKRLRDDFNGYL